MNERRSTSGMQVSDQSQSESRTSVDPAFRIKACEMIEELLKFYEFGVDLDLLSEDFVLHGHLRAIKQHFKVLKPEARQRFGFTSTANTSMSSHYRDSDSSHGGI